MDQVTYFLFSDCLTFQPSIFYFFFYLTIIQLEIDPNGTDTRLRMRKHVEDRTRRNSRDETSMIPKRATLHFSGSVSILRECQPSAFARSSPKFPKTIVNLPVKTIFLRRKPFEFRQLLAELRNFYSNLRLWPIFDGKFGSVKLSRFLV